MKNNVNRNGMNLRQKEVERFALYGLNSIVELSEPSIKVNIDENNKVSYTLTYYEFIKGQKLERYATLNLKQFLDIVVMGMNMLNYEVDNIKMNIKRDSLFYSVRAYQKEDKFSLLKRKRG